MALIQFDARAVAPDEGRSEAVPAGWYNVALEKSEKKPTKAGDGAYINCVFGILDGQYKGNKIFHMFNMWNNNPKAVEIAYAQFSALCHAVGHLMVGDSEELHGRPLKLRVTLKPAEGEYAAKNEIAAYKNINEVVPANVAPVVSQPKMFPPVSQPATPAQPWAPAAQPQTQAPVQQPAWAPPQGAQQPWANQPAQQAQTPAVQPTQPAWAAPQQAAPVQPMEQPQFQQPTQQVPNQPVQPPWMTPKQF